ncbi:hypothetical protein FA15DRAFT_698128, partial [Coprinopsis marcescibilis]
MSARAIDIQLVASTELIESCVADLYGTPNVDDQPSPGTTIAVDLEGINLCRDGQVCIVQLKSDTSKTVWLLNVTALGQTAFDHQDSHGRSIRTLLESTNIKKIFYDVRNDADALYNNHDIDMKSVCDLQILELAYWRQSKWMRTIFLNGLYRAVTVYLSPPPEWRRVKDAGRALFSPEEGGSYEVLAKRPLDPQLLQYCAQDVVLLAELEAKLRTGLGSSGTNWNARVDTASEKRVNEAKLSYRVPDG